MICENPSIYLNELCAKMFEVTGVVVSGPTVCRIMHNNGLTRKKLVKVALQRSTEYRAAFMANVLHYPGEFLVWVDETGTDRRDQLRHFGYAMRGEPAVQKQLLTRGTRFSATVAMSSDGVEGYELSEGTINSVRFVDFIRGSFIPIMRPYPDKHSIVIMDNCCIHHVQQVRDMFSDFGVLLLFLPPYSPDLNPIEELFSYMKYCLKSHDTLIQALPSPLTLIEAALDSATSLHCNGWINHSGYN